MTALSRSAVYALMAESWFPKPIRGGPAPVPRAGARRCLSAAPCSPPPACRPPSAPTGWPRPRRPACRCPTCCGSPWSRHGRGPRRRVAVERERTVQTARIGNNLNQLARWANTYAERAEAVEVIAHLVAIEPAIAELARFRREDARAV